MVFGGPSGSRSWPGRSLAGIRTLVAPVRAFGSPSRWIEAGEDHGVITLLPYHSFLSPRGDRARFHQWEIGRQALWVVWLSGIDRFTNIESPALYTATPSDGRVLRMEKEP